MTSMWRFVLAVALGGLLCLAALPASAQDGESIIAYVNPEGTVGNQDFGGPLGMDFDVKLDILVTHLGVFDSGSDGLSLPITASLWDRSIEEELDSIEFTPEDPGELIGGSRFKELSDPIDLAAGDVMTIVAEGYGAGEPNGNTHGQPADVWSTNPGPCSISFVGGGRFGDPGAPRLFPATLDGGPVNRYAAGTFEFKVAAVEGVPVFHRGDPNDDGSINISDGLHTLNLLFANGPDATCKESQDFNNDGVTNITDGVGIFSFLFQGGAAPPAPGPTTEPCGPDPDDPGSAGDLGCEEYTNC